MYTSFSTALSALGAHAMAVDVVGNNLANLNTAGFKASTVSFSDLVTQSLGAGLGQTQVGFGVSKPLTIRQFSQGAIQPSANPLDAAIQGDGFLVVKDREGRQLYTRGGNLAVDKDGRLQTANGAMVQGWMASGGTIDSNGSVGDVIIPVGTLRPPVATTKFSFDLNLNSAATEGTEFSSSVTVYDSLGGSHVVTATFTKSSAANEWAYSLSFPDADVATPITPITGTLTFDGDGKLTNPTLTSTTPQLAITGLKNGASDMAMSWNLFNGITPRVTQYSQPSAPSAISQDGSSAAQLTRVGLADGGAIIAKFSDGTQARVGQLAMASIRNPESLLAVGENNYQLGAQSATPAIGMPGTGGRGNILGGAVEASTVDIAREFTNLIVLQRGYQANTKVITTVDEISQDTINLKR